MSMEQNLVPMTLTSTTDIQMVSPPVIQGDWTGGLYVPPKPDPLEKVFAETLPPAREAQALAIPAKPQAEPSLLVTWLLSLFTVSLVSLVVRGNLFKPREPRK